MRYIPKISLAVFFCMLLVWQSNATAEDLALGRMQDQLERLQKDLSQLQKQVYKGGGISRGKGVSSAGDAGTEVRLVELEEKIRQINGQMEEVGHRIDTITVKMDKIIADIDFRISAIESRKSQPAYQSGAAVVPETVNGDASAPIDTMAKKEEGAGEELVTKLEKTSASEESLDTTGLYDQAFEYLRNSEYDKAEVTLKDFIKSNKDSHLISNAYYWLGESFYVRENYQQSAVYFLKGYQEKPEGRKAADNLLKLGMSLDKLSKKDEACATYDKLLEEFPKAESAIVDKTKGEIKRLSCS